MNCTHSPYDESNVEEFIEYVGKALQRIAVVNSVILIGSYARKDYDEHSDIDLVVITNKNVLRSELQRYIDSSTFISKLSLLPCSKRRFTEKYNEGNLFVRHFITEGRVLSDDGFLKNLTAKRFQVTIKSAATELEIIKERLKFYENPLVFNNHFFYTMCSLSRLFSQLMLIAIALRKEYEFNKHKAMIRFIELYPSLKDDVMLLNSLEKFSLLSSGTPKDYDPVTVSMVEVQEQVSKLKRLTNNIESKFE